MLCSNTVGLVIAALTLDNLPPVHFLDVQWILQIIWTQQDG